MNETIDRALDMLEVLATKLGTTAEQLWMVMVRQQQLNAVSLIIGLMMAIIAFVIACVMYKKRFSTIQAMSFDLSSNWHFVHVTTIIASGLASVTLIFCCVDDLPGMLFNPEYRALLKVMEIIK